MLGRARVLHVPGADADANAGDRNYLVLAKPNLIMNDIRLRGLAVGGSDAAGRKSPDNHAQTARNLRRSLRTAAAGARLIQAGGLDSKSAADASVSLAEASKSFIGSSAGSIDVLDAGPLERRRFHASLPAELPEQPIDAAHETEQPAARPGRPCANVPLRGEPVLSLR